MKRMSSRRWLPVARVALVAGTLLAGTAGARTDADGCDAGPLAGLIKQSKKESGLVFYANAPASNLKVVTDRFQYYHPWIKTTSYDLDNNVIFSKYASRPPRAPAPRTCSSERAEPLGLRDATEVPGRLRPAELSAFPSFAKQYKGVFIISPDPAVIMYNKLLLKDKVPTSVTADRERPGHLRVKLTGYTVDNLFGYTGALGLRPEEGLGEPREDRQAGSRRRPASPVSSPLVSQGAAVAAYLTSPTVRLNIKNEPACSRTILDWAYNKDATPLVPRGMGITVEGEEPRVREAVPELALHKAGQQAMCDAGFTAFRTGFTRRRAAPTRSPTSTPRSARRTCSWCRSARSSSTTTRRSRSAGTGSSASTLTRTDSHDLHTPRPASATRSTPEPLPAGALHWATGSSSYAHRRPVHSACSTPRSATARSTRPAASSRSSPTASSSATRSSGTPGGTRCSRDHDHADGRGWRAAVAILVTPHRPARAARGSGS